MSRRQRDSDHHRGERTRSEILATAVDIASAEGLGGLTIGRLAAAMRMSKSGIFAHFGSKEELQLAAVDAARAIAAAEVLRPGLTAGSGLRRVWGLLDNYLFYLERRVFRGGCFFIAASAEVDGRPGPVRDRVAAVMRDWLRALEASIAEARSAGEIRAGLDDAQLAFELNALVMGANWAFQLLGDEGAFRRARHAVGERLRSLATPSAPALPLV
ncbi:MAG: TetR/AcrR family transcriptional regulator [Candidatus Binatia bacterium]